MPLSHLTRRMLFSTKSVCLLHVGKVDLCCATRTMPPTELSHPPQLKITKKLVYELCMRRSMMQANKMVFPSSTETWIH